MFGSIPDHHFMASTMLPRVRLGYRLCGSRSVSSGSNHWPSRDMNTPKPFVKGKRGVVGVMIRGERLLTIRRSQHVTAPGKLCLPGGTIEVGESEQQALIREMREELSIDVMPMRCCWRSVTPWGTKLAFWWASLDEQIDPVPDLAEVAAYHWMNLDEILHASDVLPSLPRFLDAWREGEVDLPILWR